MFLDAVDRRALSPQGNEKGLGQMDQSGGEETDVEKPHIIQCALCGQRSLHQPSARLCSVPHCSHSGSRADAHS